MSEANEKLKSEFNEWAADGRGEEMENHHAGIAEPVFVRMALQSGERVLDLGCGAGWATRKLARAVEGGPGMAVGHDISDEMIGRARAASTAVDNVLFTIGAADEIPWRDEYFDKVLSIESFYYYPDPSSVLRELLRALAPGGSLYILINLYRENPYSLRWVKELKVPVQVHSEGEYAELLRAAGFVNVAVDHIPDPTPTPDDYSGKWFANAEELRDFKRIGALLLTARKPPAE
ncbi:MAG: methyltransferase domain-containing protein [Acidobacteriota bacterium]|nr:methyltransferase domain-containing protein [Acidobacteriota bacterium]